MPIIVGISVANDDGKMDKIWKNSSIDCGMIKRINGFTLINLVRITPV